MPVKVYKTPSVVAETYSQADEITVKDGHLFVIKDAQSIAVYSPGNWHHGDVTVKAA
jgi:hypothetical protein